MEVGLHQESALSPFLFAMVIDRLTDEVKQESPLTVMFAGDVVICSESREQVEENLENLQRRGMKVSHSKTEYMCVSERNPSGTVRLHGAEIKKVEDFNGVYSPEQCRVWKGGEEGCASRLERMEKCVRCDKSTMKE